MEPTYHETNKRKREISRVNDELFESWRVSSQYHVKRLIGVGSYGEVVEAIDPRNPMTKFAIKRIQYAFDRTSDARRLYREVHILRMLKNSYVIDLIDVLCPYLDEPNTAEARSALFSNHSSSSSLETGQSSNDNSTLHSGCTISSESSNSDSGNAGDSSIKRARVVSSDSDMSLKLRDIYLIFELAGTDLYKLINSPQYLSLSHIKYFLHQILMGIKFIHSGNVIHRDLKPSNILVNEDCTLKICDFGMARVVPSEMFRGGKQNTALTDGGPDGADIMFAAKRGVEFTIPTASTTSVSQSNLEQKISALRAQAQFSGHVMTRWYRAPEVVLAEPYNAAVDMWSIGCIFAELLMMQRECMPDPSDRKPLFPGKFCPVLSPRGNEDNNEALPCGGSPRQRTDQLSLIFDVIGTPTDSDLLSIRNERTREVLKLIRRKPPKDLSSLFPGTCPEALSLLEGLLRFDPNRRLNVEEALNHEFLQDFRDESIEEVCPHPLQASVEAVNEASPNLINSVVDEISYYVKKSPTSSIQQHNHESDDDNWDYAVKKIRSDSM